MLIEVTSLTLWSLLEHYDAISRNLLDYCLQ
jgi:hypothetical protein